MAKLALVLRDQKRRKTVAKFKVRRTALLEIIYDSRASDEAKEEARRACPLVPDLRRMEHVLFQGDGGAR